MFGTLAPWLRGAIQPELCDSTQEEQWHASTLELGYICLYPFSNGKFNPHLRKEGTLGKTGVDVEVAPFLLRVLFGGFQTNCQTHSSPFRCGNGGERAEGSCGQNKSVRESLHTFRQSKNSDG